MKAMNLVERVAELERLVNRLSGVVAGLSNHVGFDVESATVEVSTTKPAKPEPRYEDEESDQPTQTAYLIATVDASGGKGADRFFHFTDAKNKVRWTEYPRTAKRFDTVEEADRVRRQLRGWQPAKFGPPTVRTVSVEDLE